MGLDNLFSDKKTITVIAMIVIGVGLLGDFVASIVWWSRIQPWFSHGLKSGKTVYQCILACWVLSLVGLIAIIIFIIFTFFVSSICDSITGNTLILTICIVIVGAVSVGSIVSGAYGSSFAVKNPFDYAKKCYEDGDYENPDDDCIEEYLKNKCVIYVSEGADGASQWAEKNGKEDDLRKWKEKYIYTKNKQLCGDVGIPTLVFALVQAIGIIIFIVAIVLAVTGFSKVG